MEVGENDGILSTSQKLTNSMRYGALLESQTRLDGQNADLSAVNRSADNSGNQQSSVESSHDSQRVISNFAVILHVIKGNIGIGILAMPNAFANSGVLFGPLGLVILGVICIHCMHLLVKSSQYHCRRLGISSLDYAQVAEKAFSCHRALERHSKKARIAVNVSLVITQFGGCSVYLLFIATNIQQIVIFGCGSTCSTSYPMSLPLYELVLAFTLAGFVMLRDIKHLTPFSLMANILSVIGLLLIIYYTTIHHTLKDITRLPLVTEWSTIPLFFGTAIFAFEGIGVMLPLENKMRQPSAFLPLCGVLNVGMTIVCVLYLTIGFYGYIEFGKDSKGSITLNIDSWYGVIVKSLFSLCIFVSYGIQFYVLITILNDSFRSTRIANKIGEGKLDIILRLVLVALTYGVAATFGNLLNLLISLIGAFTSTALTLIFPPILDTLTEVMNHRLSRPVILVKNLLILILGVVGCVIGTYTSVYQLVHQSNN